MICFLLQPSHSARWLTPQHKGRINSYGRALGEIIYCITTIHSSFWKLRQHQARGREEKHISQQSLGLKWDSFPSAPGIVLPLLQQWLRLPRDYEFDFSRDTTATQPRWMWHLASWWAEDGHPVRPNAARQSTVVPTSPSQSAAKQCPGQAVGRLP